MTIYFVAGEVSGDNHGAALMSSLQKHDVDFATASPSGGGLKFMGRGGPQMRAIAGGGFKDWLDEAAVLGLWEVIKKYGYFREQFRATLREIEKARPDAVVLIDYPGFNLRVARALWNTDLQSVHSPDFQSGESNTAGQADGFPTTKPRRKLSASPIAAGEPLRPKVIYYISPQVWAWNRGRIAQMARWLDLMLCIFPFEAELYTKSGLRTEFVGHPMIDRLRSHQIDIARDPNLIGLFPGSRGREIRKILPILLESARALHRSKPNLRFEVAAASPQLAAEIRKMMNDSPAFKIVVGQTSTLMQRAVAGVIASGSATLEAAYFRLPFVLVYKVAWPTYVAARMVVKVKHLGMPNVLADEEIVPEFIQHQAKPGAIAKTVEGLIDDPLIRKKMIAAFDSIITPLGQGGASDRAAKAIVEELRSGRRSC
jgi:lipid-A-disaccharide synthase